MPGPYIKKLDLNQGQVSHHTIGTGASNPNLLGNGLPVWPGAQHNLNKNIALNSLGNDYPNNPTNHNNNFPKPNLISNMFDGNKGTAFRSLGPVNRNSWLTIDLGKQIVPAKIVITIPYVPPNFDSAGMMIISYTNSLEGNFLFNTPGYVQPTSGYTDVDFISKVIAPNTGNENTVLSPANSGTEVINGDDNPFNIFELTENDPTNGGLIGPEGRRYIHFQFFDTVYSGNFGISNIEIWAEISGESQKRYNIEFDDALLDLEGWKNPRYYGSKLTGKLINEYNGPSGSYAGDITYGKNPVVENKTTALYIVDTIVGGEEDPQFAQFKGHSYLGIKQILVIDEEENTVQIIDRNAEDFNVFHRFITNDFPTGGKFKAKIIDNSIQNNLKNEYFVKFNKGYLLRAFNFKLVNDSITHKIVNEDPGFTGGGNIDEVKFNNIFLYGDNFVEQNQLNFVNIQNRFQPQDTTRSSSLFFSFANSSGISSATIGDELSPSFDSSSIFKNKFTRQYYSGSIGIIEDEGVDGYEYTDGLSAGTTVGSVHNSSYFKAQKFIMIDTLNFLRENETTTELHLTLLQGSKDFAPGFNDERSIGTFEVSSETRFQEHTVAMGFLPVRSELKLRGKSNDNRFYPQINAYTDRIRMNYVIAKAFGTNLDFVPSSSAQSNSPITDLVTSNRIFIQGGPLGSHPKTRFGLGVFNAVAGTSIADWTIENDYSGSYYSRETDTGIGIILNPQNQNPNSFQINSGSSNARLAGGLEAHRHPNFDYELSWLDKDHTLISNINKEEELFDGMGQKGIVLIPEHLTPDIKRNVDFYLKQAGITEKITKKAPRRPERGR